MRICAAIILLCSLIQSAGAAWTWTPQEQARVKQLNALAKKDGAFFQIDTGTWNVRTDVSQEFAAELTCFYELFHEQFMSIVQIKSKPQVASKLNVVLYAKEADYRKTFDDGTRGYFRYKWDGDGTFTEFTLFSFVQYPNEREFSKFYHPILLHEGTHMLLQKYAGKNKIPVFINEGLANYFQYWNMRRTLAENLARRKNDSFFHKLLLERLRSDKAFTPNLASMLKLDYNQWNPDKMGPEAKLNYALGESFIETLATEPQMRGVLPTILEKALAGKEVFTQTETQQANAVWITSLRR